MKLGVAFAWHTHPWEELLALVKLAEGLGFSAAFVDGDVSMLASKSERDVLHGWTVAMALLARTERIQIGSIRLVHHWNAAQLAQAVATAERLTPGRLRCVIAAGDRPNDANFGFPDLPVGERIRLLDETLEAMQCLWRGETVTRSGRYVQLERARVRPIPPGGAIPIAIAARGPRMLRRVAAHAQIWEVNLPPIAAHVSAAAATLAEACRERGRDPDEIRRSLWIFTRLDPAGDVTAALPEFRRLNPWFDEFPDDEVRASLVVGKATDCRRRLSELTAELSLELPVVDLSGLDAVRARRLMEALAPSNSDVDART
ncbi:MAG: LLM class flavin-dependent oxidoreductase [Deltaproteobacteria bacterium]|nr:LLM class flavin-dependent oxidoreductase [Deltaproteobacteria bacterium]